MKAFERVCELGGDCPEEGLERHEEGCKAHLLEHITDKLREEGGGYEGM